MDLHASGVGLGHLRLTDGQQRLFATLAEDGTQHMPLDDYGFGPFDWVEDRFGVSWQLSAPG